MNPSSTREGPGPIVAADRIEAIDTLRGVALLGILVMNITGMLRAVAAEIEAKVAAGEQMTERRQALVDQWDDLRRSFAPTPEEVEEKIAVMRGPATAVLAANVEETVSMHTQAVPFMLFWRAMGMVLLGMGLMKAGVFSVERSPSFYRAWVAAGFGRGLPVVAVGIWRWRGNGFDFVSGFLVDGQFNYFGSVLVSMGYVAVVMLASLSGALPGL